LFIHFICVSFSLPLLCISDDFLLYFSFHFFILLSLSHMAL
jgi:hypothetical protein